MGKQQGKGDPIHVEGRPDARTGFAAFVYPQTRGEPDDGLREEPGWRGLFTRAEAPGALRNGTRIEKCNSRPGDAGQDGSRGTVLGSVSTDASSIAYFVEWDAHPRMAVFTTAARVRAVK